MNPFQIMLLFCCKANPVGGKGSDYVTSCNIDEETNILYYIGGNYHSCSSVFGQS